MEEEEQEFLEKVQMEMHLQKDGKKYVLTNRHRPFLLNRETTCLKN